MNLKPLLKGVKVHHEGRGQSSEYLRVETKLDFISFGSFDHLKDENGSIDINAIEEEFRKSLLATITGMALEV